MNTTPPRIHLGLRSLAVAVSAALVALTLAFVASPAQAAGTTTITGKVVVSGKPVAGIKAMAYSPDNLFGAPGASGKPSSTSVSNAQGKYTLKVPAGEYALLLFKDTRLKYTYPTVKAALPDANYITDTKAVSGAMVNFRNVSLVAGAKLSGNVRASSGPKGMSRKGLRVTAINTAKVTGSMKGWEHQETAKTNSKGTFSMRPMIPGKYKVHYSTGFKDVWYNAKRTQKSANTVSLGKGKSKKLIFAAPKAKTKTSLSVKPGKRKATLTYQVKKGSKYVSGKAQIAYKVGKKKKYKTVKVKKGKTKVTLKKLRKGKQSFKVTFLGTNTLKKSAASKKVRVR